MGFLFKLKEKFKKSNDKELVTYNSALKESRENFTNKINKLAKKYKNLDDDFFDELEEILIGADCGVSYTYKIIEELAKKIKKENIKDTSNIQDLLYEIMFNNYLETTKENLELDFNKTPKIILVIGVNGVGKTTTIAKLTYRFISKNKKVLLIAADTFRAGAKEQLTYWSKKLGCDIQKSLKENSDPASVVYDGLTKSKNSNYDLIIIDTAGRLQNKVNLMKELKKIYEVSKKCDLEISEVFLVLDATNGQNGIIQAKSFKELLPITGIILTKMDGTSKGGIILAINNELNLPVKYIGLGEKMEDLELFDINKYLLGLLSDE